MTPVASKQFHQSRPHALTVRPPVVTKPASNEVLVKNNRMDSSSVPVFRPLVMDVPKMSTMANQNYVNNVFNRRLAFSDNLVPTQVNAMAYDIPAFQHIPNPLERVGISDNYISPNMVSSFNSKSDRESQTGQIYFEPTNPTPIYDPFLIEPTKKPLVDLRGHTMEVEPFVLYSHKKTLFF